MNNSILKTIKPFSWITLSLLALIVAATVIAIVVRQQQKNRINTALKILQDSNQPVKQVEATLEILYQSENEFREYTLTYDKAHLENYRKSIVDLKAHIDTLQQMSLQLDNDESKDRVQQTLLSRNKEAGKYLRLNRLTDSLMIVLAVFDSVPLKNANDKIALRSFTIEDSNINIDTIGMSNTTKTRKKGLFGKIKSFLVGEKETQQVTKTKMVVKTNKTTKTDTVASPTNSIRQLANLLIDRGNTFYKKQMKNMLRKRMEQRASELKLVQMNNSLMSEIKGMLDDMQLTFQNKDSHVRGKSTTTIYQSSSVLHTVLLITIIGIFLLALAVVYMLRRKSIDNEIIKASEQKAVEEASEKSKFLAYMSHEFRCPVSLVLGYTEQLEQTGLSAEQAKYLSNLKSSSEILLSTVNDILDLSTLRAGQMALLSEPFNTEEALNKAIATFQQQAKEKNLQLKYNPTDNTSLVVGDEIRLRQIINNLLSNAIKYTKQGSVSVSSALVPANGKMTLELKIADTGIGIPEDKLGQVFDEYKRVHDSTSSDWIIGTGLGLSVTRQLVERMGGTITLKSELSKGSEFTVRIPFQPYLGTLKTKQAASIKKAVLPDNLKILVADDNYLNISLLKSVFERTNAVVDVAENGQIAFDKLCTQKYDILLSDLYMPVMNGIELAKRIRAHQSATVKNIPIIVLSGNISPEITKEIMDAGISGYLLKPYQQNELFSLIVKQFK